jgi:tetratricopeptide (TPR) repeat protein
MVKSIEDVSRSIEYAYNNYEAHVLKGLILMEREDYIDAAKSFIKAERINPDNLIIKNLRMAAISKASMNPEIESSF